MYPKLRSMNAELDQGSIDGTYKRVVNDRGGVVEPLTEDTRRDLSDVWFGIHEKFDKRRPDGKAITTPYFEPTSAVRGLLGYIG